MVHKPIAFLSLLLLPVGIAHASNLCDPAAIQLATTPAPPEKQVSLDHFQKQMSSVPQSADVVLIGDSQTGAWPSLITKQLFRDRTVLNWGSAGDKTENLLWRLDRFPKSDLHPSLVMLLIGTNNLAAGAPACAILSGVKQDFSVVRQAWPSAHVLMLGVLRRGPTFRSSDTERITLNTALGMFAAAQSNTAFLDVSDELDCDIHAHVSRPPAPGTSSCVNYKPDLLHLTPIGYGRLAKSLHQFDPDNFAEVDQTVISAAQAAFEARQQAPGP